MKKKIKFVECPNCGATLKRDDDFEFHWNLGDYPFFICEECHYKFEYPQESAKFRNRIFFGLFLIFVLPASFAIIDALMYYGFQGETLTILNFSSVVFGIVYLINGIIKSIKNSSLKQKFPEWSTRMHNTVSTLRDLDTSEEDVQGEEQEEDVEEEEYQDEDKQEETRIGCLGLWFAILIVLGIVLLIAIL